MDGIAATGAAAEFRVLAAYFHNTENAIYENSIRNSMLPDHGGNGNAGQHRGAFDPGVPGGHLAD